MGFIPQIPKSNKTVVANYTAPSDPTTVWLDSTTGEFKKYDGQTQEWTKFVSVGEEVNDTIVTESTTFSSQTILQLASYTHEQTTPSMVWDIQHNMHRIPNVNVYNEAGEQIIGDVVQITEENLTITFSEPLTGTAICN